MQPQNNKLTRLEEGGGLPIDWRENAGSKDITLLVNIRESPLSKAGPRGPLLLIGQSGIPHSSFGIQVLLEHRLERTLPTLAKGWDLQRALQLPGGMSWQIEEGVNLGHTESLRAVSKFCDVVAGANFSLLQHAEVKTRSMVLYQQCRHARFIHAN